MRRTTVLLSTLSLVALLPATVRGQRHLRVAVAVNDSLADRIFSSKIAAAFRALGDVDVVEDEMTADYIVQGVILCRPSRLDCEHAVEYSVALVVSEPLTEAGLSVAAFMEGRRLADSTARKMLRDLGRQEKIHGIWAASWGREAYEQAIREWVASVDGSCLRYARLIRDFTSSKDATVLAEYRRKLNEAQAAC